MTATEQHTDEAPITWTRKKEWGYDTMVHLGEATINGEHWTFHVGYHGSHNWVARGWRNGAFAMYRQTRTMKAAKAEVQAQANYAATQTCGSCLKIGGHTEDCVLITSTVDLSRIASDLKAGFAAMAPIVTTAAASFGRLIRSFQLARPCDCPTPTHRMSCGVGATPKVVSK